MTTPRRTIAAFVAAAFSLPATAQQSASAPPVEVLGATPVPGLNVPADTVPGNVQSIDGTRLHQRATLPELLNAELPGVSVNEIQSNPYQVDVNYRGFTASPLLGTPQGLSVFVDGVRVNEPFGDIVNWDLVPQAALASITLVPGSNPLFGLNTLGGALSLRTRSGDTHPGTRIEMLGGSFDRRTVEAETAGRIGPLYGYLAATHVKENGWRDFSPSEVNQVFAKLSQRGEGYEWDASLIRAGTDLTGNGLVPASMFAQRREQVFTLPDNTRNKLTQLTLNAEWWLATDSQLAATAYYRRNNVSTLNGDANDGFEDGPNDGVSADDSAANNRTRTRQRGAGFALQWSHIGTRNQYALGFTHDRSRSRFEQSSQLGVFNAVRGVIPEEDEELENRLRGRTRSTGLFITDTYALTPALHLTAAARYNHTRVTTVDEGPNAPALDGDFTYKKLNPAIGATFQATPALTFYGGYSQGSRAPSPIELGCADPANPCTLPNALASDPFLKQVVARTLEAGVRGKLGANMRWNLGAFRTSSRDDILFVGTTTSAGFFTNFGRTRRQGIESGLSDKAGRFEWNANYSYVRATFESAACLLSENNSTRGTSAACTSPDGDLIEVRPGNRIPGIPEHNLKLAASFKAAERLTVAAELLAFSSQYVRGNENNAHQPDGVDFLGAGKAPGYAVMNLRATAGLGGGWELFGRINNLFDRKYYSAGALAENPFDANGAFQVDSGDWKRETFYAPGAPRALWVGIRYEAR